MAYPGSLSCSRRASTSDCGAASFAADSLNDARLASAAAARASAAASCSRRSSAVLDAAAASCSRRSSSLLDAAVDGSLKKRLLTKASAGDSADVASSCSRRSSLSMLS